MKRGPSGQALGWHANSFLIGGLVGAGTALLLAPKPGRETRKQIRGMVENARDTTEDYYEQVKRTAASVLEKGERFLGEKKGVIAKATRGDRYSCESCGLVLSVDEECGCAEAHEVICCGEQMKVRR